MNFGIESLPSFILAFAEPIGWQDSTSSPITQAAQTETYQEGKGGGRDADVEALAMATATELGDPTARDTDIEQLDYAAIGCKKQV